jgi:hypothetical protein
MAGELYINGQDTGTLGLVVARAEADYSGPPRRVRTSPVPGRYSEVVLSAPRRQEFRGKRIRVQGHVLGTDYAQVQLRLSWLKAWMSDDNLRIRFANDTLREAVGYLEQFTATARGGAFVSTGRAVLIEFFCPDGRRRKTTQNTPSLSTSPASITLGDSPSGGVIRIDGAVTDPVLTYKHYDGTTLATMSFTRVLSGGQYLDIDLDNRTIVDHAAANAINDLDAGSDWFLLDPRDGDITSYEYPTLTLSGGTGTATYYEMYE